MKWLIILFFYSMASLSSEIDTLKLSNSGYIRYFSDGFKLKRIERLSNMNEIMYSCSYEYDENENLVLECLRNANGEIVYKNSFDLIEQQNQPIEPLASLHKNHKISVNRYKIPSISIKVEST